MMTQRDIEKQRFMLAKITLDCEKPSLTHTDLQRWSESVSLSRKLDNPEDPDTLLAANMGTHFKAVLFAYMNVARAGLHVVEIDLYSNVWDEDAQEWHLRVDVWHQRRWTPVERLKLWWNRRLKAMLVEVKK